MMAARSTVWRDNAFAAGLAVLLAAGWAFQDWSPLSALRLPDTDDAMRLQQIRDWIGGQPFGDLAQHRLGLAGLEMHWSRLPDLIPATINMLLTPLTGVQGAELAAVLIWPALLFMAALILIGSLARRLGVSAPVAIVIAALAYPANTLFLPGRIDHHGLQLVLCLLLVRAAIGAAGWRAGAVAGLASVTSLVVGMEALPILVAGGALILWRWVVADDEQQQLTGYAVALAGGLLAAAWLFRTSGWSYPACDGFGAAAWRAAQIGAMAPLGLALAGRWLSGWHRRLLFAVGAGVIAGWVALAASPGCLSPYGGVDPLLSRLWLDRVAEAQPLFASPVSQAVGYAGLAVVGLAATLWMWRRTGAACWGMLAWFQAASLALTLLQLRGVYPGAMLAAPALAGVIAAARRRGVVPLAVAWIASAGFLYPLAGGLLQTSGDPEMLGAGMCDVPQAVDLLRQYPAGTVAGPIDLGAWALAGTPHRLLAAPYHRNTDGIRLSWRLMLSPKQRAEALARTHGIGFLVDCPGAYRELGALPANSLLHRLRTGDVPDWLEPLPGTGRGVAIWRVRVGNRHSSLYPLRQSPSRLRGDGAAR
ncbi:MAG: hypothetical protein CVT77_13180 [Alphaproteobacteria bacterium HGW-Alphaproteobacteria-16]|nr:MAG: hypothetical protein CVT77_13180 [Alphaproteobacteria bacterium HGW-Alphaproteobacteria-16]